MRNARVTHQPTCLFINNSPQPGRKTLAKLGGGGKSLLTLLSELPKHGWEIHVVVPGEGQFTDELIKMGIPFFPSDRLNGVILSLHYVAPLSGGSYFSE